MTSDLDQVVAALRAAGWRSSEDRLQTTALKRLATARRHQQQAADLRADAQLYAEGPWRLRRRFLEGALRHEVRAAERAGVVTRAVREVALKLVPTWTSSGDELLAVAQAVAEPAGTRAASSHGATTAALPSEVCEAPGPREAQAS